MEVRIYVVNLEKFHTGEEAGKWLTLPMDKDNLIEEMEALVGKSDYEIRDYEGPLYVGPYDDPYELNEQLIDFETVSRKLNEKQIYALLLCVDSLEEAIDMIRQDKVRFYDTEKKYPKWSDLAETLVYDYGYMNVPDRLKAYIDYDYIGRGLQTMGTWFLCKNGVAIEEIY